MYVLSPPQIYNKTFTIQRNIRDKNIILILYSFPTLPQKRRHYDTLVLFGYVWFITTETETDRTGFKFIFLYDKLGVASIRLPTLLGWYRNRTDHCWLLTIGTPSNWLASVTTLAANEERKKRWRTEKEEERNQESIKE